MADKEFNLSEKIGDFRKGCIDWWENKDDGDFIKKEDVKEFIRRLKEFEWTSIFIKERQQNMIEAYKLKEFFDKIDKLAGEKLI